MHWLVGVLAAVSGITMSFAICAFIWTWYVGTIVLVLAEGETQPRPVPAEPLTLVVPTSRS
jgi:hypothetical protein